MQCHLQTQGREHSLNTTRLTLPAGLLVCPAPHAHGLSSLQYVARAAESSVLTYRSSIGLHGTFRGCTLQLRNPGRLDQCLSCPGQQVQTQPLI